MRYDEQNFHSYVQFKNMLFGAALLRNVGFILLQSGSLERNSRKRDKLYQISSINRHSDPQ